jgi:hypothetical protein
LVLFIMGIEQNIITLCNVCRSWYTSLSLHFELLNLRILLTDTDVSGRWSHNPSGLCRLSHSQSTAQSRDYGSIKICRRCGSRNGQHGELCLSVVFVRMTKTYRVTLLRRALDGVCSFVALRKCSAWCVENKINSLGKK